jgi:hypothetical protein
MSTFPDGLFQYGGQPVGAQFASPWSTAYFVDGVNGVDDFDGKSPVKAKKTIQSAVTAAGRGDVIYIRPQTYTAGTGFARYTEQISVALAQSDLSLIGTVNSINPEYGVRSRWVTTGYNLTNDGPALHVENIGFFSESATNTALLRNSDTVGSERYGANGTTFYNCVIKGGKISVQCGDGLTIRNCMFHGGGDGVTGGIIATSVGYSNPGRRLRIRECLFQASNGSVVDTAYISINLYTEVLIDNCYFDLLPTDTNYIKAITSTGSIINCSFGVADMTLATGVVKGGLVAVNLADGKFPAQLD